MGMGTPESASVATSSVYVVIPMRKGSKGCPGKALRTFRSSTLLECAVSDALLLTDRVIVTTDYAESDMPMAARPFYQRRPDHLCRDDSPMTLVLKHAAQSMYPSDTILLIQPNCYHSDRVRLAKRVLAEKAAGTSVRYPDFWHPAYAIGHKRMPPTRQGLEPVYRPDGLLYRMKVASLMLIDPFKGPYIPVEGTANVDTESDWTALNERYGL